MTPSDWRAESNTTIGVRPVALDLVEAKIVTTPVAWDQRSREWLFVRGAGTQENHGALPRRRVESVGATVAGQAAPTETYLEFAPTGSDTWLIGTDLEPRVEVIQAEAWSAFLRRHIPDRTVPAGVATAPRTVSVRHHESTKTLVVVRDAQGRSGSSGTAMGKTGQRMEIRPLADPCITTPGSDLPMRVYVPRGVPKALRATATQLKSGQRVSMSFDIDGQGSLVIPSAGPWVIEVHGVVRSVPDAKHTWELYTTTLAFEAPAAPPTEKSPKSSSIKRSVTDKKIERSKKPASGSKRRES